MTKYFKFKDFLGNGHMYLKFKEFQSRGTLQRAVISSRLNWIPKALNKKLPILVTSVPPLYGDKSRELKVLNSLQANLSLNSP
jgi:hypothetical protein